jgi:hypothetical protein
VNAAVRRRPLAAAAAVVAAWSGAQFWLAHRAVAALRADSQRSYRFFLTQSRVLHVPSGQHIAPPQPAYIAPDSLWIRAGIESALGALLVLAVAAALIRGGRRWVALLILAIPLANVLDGLDNGPLLGIGWNQLGPSSHAWLALGFAVDSLLLLAVTALLIRALPPRLGRMSAAVAVTRALPPLLVLAGWWLAHAQLVDPVNRAWLAQAVAFVLIAALLAGSSLPLAGRATVILGVLPMCVPGMLDDLIGSGSHFDALTYLHHAAFAAATALFVAGVPALVRRYPILARGLHSRATLDVSLLPESAF